MKKWGRISILLLAIVFLVSMLPAATPVYAAEAAWTAYNDCNWISPQPNSNITQITVSGTTSGILKKYADGADTSITATFTTSGTLQTTSSGAVGSSGTDAYTTFNGKASAAGVVNGTSSGWSIDLTLNGMDPTKTYTFAGTAIRAGTGSATPAYSTRNSTFILSEDDAANNASTSGITVVDSHTIAFNTGNNSTQGYVVRWTGINPGSDGTIKIQARASTTSEISGSSTNAYGLSVFMLQEESTAPVINVSGSLDQFSALPGVGSEAQTYTVSGTNLTEDINIAAPTGFQISTDDANYLPNLTLSQSGGTVSSTTIYVRLYSATEGDFSGNIVHTSSGATTRDVAVSGSAGNVTLVFQDGLHGYTGTRDTYIYDVEPDTVRGTETTIVQDKNTNDERRSLLLFDLSSIPAGSAIVSAELQFYVSAEGQGFNMYRMLVPWDEATVTFNTIGGRHFQTDGVDAESSINANWPGGDGYTGVITVAVPASTIQDWVNGTLDNNGWLMIATDVDDGQQLRSKEYSTQSERPKLTVEYSSSSEPTITVSGSLSAFNSEAGEPSAEQAYAVSGINLTEDIAITAPADFEISTASGSGFGPSLTLTQSGGTVASTPIYVRYNRAAEGSSSGVITHTSTGATTKNMAVNGTAVLPGTWIAYNDCAYIDGQTTANITTYEGYTNGASGLLKKYSDGINTAVTMTVVTSGTVDEQISSDYIGAETNSGTDTYDTFHDYVNMVGGIRLGAADSYIDITFTGLNPGDVYSFATTANRANSDADYLTRITEFTISDTDAATNSSTSGVTVNSNESVSFCTGYNTVNGYVARWTNIQPGSDGDFTVRFSVDTENSNTYAYGPSVLLLQDGTTHPVNHAPGQPVLVQPVDDATGVSTSPALEVNVTDPDSDNMDVTFYGRETGATAPGADFTIVVIPDTQNESQYAPEMFNSQTNWIVANKTSQNIVFVTNVGDLVNTASDTTQYANADAAIDILDTGSVAYGICPGNHDTTSGTLYSNYFGASRFTGKSWYQGSYDDYNNYSFFTASGMDFMVIDLQYSPGAAVLNWADGLLKANPNRRAIVAQHDILNVDNSWNNQASFTALKDNPNLFLMVCGHMHAGSDGAAYRAETGDDGHTIHIMQADYQDFSNGNGYLRILRFSPADNKIYATTYSPYTDASITTSPDQMAMDYTMSSAAPFEVIGIDDDVVSGTNALLSWASLNTGTGYEWYAVVSDDSKTATGATWSFTTGTDITYAITGTVSPIAATDAGCSISGNTSPYHAGDSVSLVAHAVSGWTFNGWTGDYTGSSTTLSFTMPGSAVNVQANFTVVSGSLTAARDLPVAVTKGQTFPVAITFTAPANDFNAIGLNDLVPAGWTITLDEAGCEPDADQSNVTIGNEAQYVWNGPYSSGTAFTAVYQVTVPAGATADTYNFAGTVEYYLAGAGPFTATIAGDSSVSVSEGAAVQGVTYNIKGEVLAGVTITLEGGLQATSGEDGSYQITVPATGEWTLTADKTGYRSLSQKVTVTDLGAAYTVNFKGDASLIPNAVSFEDALACINKWKYPPSDGTGLGFSKILAVINAWKYPVE
jgi:uncharacterized repeat protein (TIGR02543 family)